MEKKLCRICKKEVTKKAGQGRAPSYCSIEHRDEYRRNYRKKWMRRKRHSERVLDKPLEDFNKTDS